MANRPIDIKIGSRRSKKEEYFPKGEKTETPKVVTSSKSNKPLYIIIAAITIIVLGGLAYLGYSWWTLRQEFKKAQMPQGIQELQKKQTEELITKVKTHAVLPGDEDPVVATVTDADALKKQSAFYELAKKDDVVIIYAKAKKAYLYDPTADKLLNIGPVVTDTQASQNVQKTTIEVRNGTGTSGAAADMVKKISDLDSSFSVLPATDADNKYNKTYLINISASDEIIKKLENSLQVTSQKDMPSGERKSSASVLVIVGK